jgi:TonB family protein
MRTASYQHSTVKKKVAYEWSPAMRRAPIDGVVGLQVTVSQTGCVRYVETRRSLQPIYDLATIQAATEWLYTPAMADGTAVESRTNIAFNVMHD